MANILSDTKKQQIIALGLLGWTLRRLEAAKGVRRETAGMWLGVVGAVSLVVAVTPLASRPWRPRARRSRARRRS